MPTKNKRKKVTSPIRDVDFAKIPPLDDPNGLLLQVQGEFRSNELGYRKTQYRLLGHVAHVWLAFQVNYQAFEAFRKNPYWTSAERRGKGKPKRTSTPAKMLRLVIEYALAKAPNRSRQLVSEYAIIIQYLSPLGVEQIPIEIEARGGIRKTLVQARRDRDRQQGPRQEPDLSDLFEGLHPAKEAAGKGSLAEMTTTELRAALAEKLGPIVVCRDRKGRVDSRMPVGTRAHLDLKMGKKGNWLVMSFEVEEAESE
jgi:hypothetical protein